MTKHMDLQSGLLERDLIFFTREPERGFAPTGIYSRTAQRNAPPQTTYVHYAADPTQLLNGTLPAKFPVPQMSDTVDKEPSYPILEWHNFSNTISFRNPLDNTTSELIEIYDRIITPYNASVFAIELTHRNLWSAYPFLAEYLTRGFPLGEMPILHENIIIPNHSSVNKHPKIVWDYIHEEAAAKRMSEPFSESEVNIAMRGFFFCSPFIVSEQQQGPDKPTKYRVCRNLSKDGRDSSGVPVPSINSHILSEHFPTTFDSATHTANLVSLALFSTP